MNIIVLGAIMYAISPGLGLFIVAIGMLISLFEMSIR